MSNRKTCGVPGCSAKLRPENASGVCATHMHRGGYYKCKACRKRGGRMRDGYTPRPEEVAGRAVRKAYKQRMGPGGNEGVVMAISLPAEPWAVDQ